MDFSQKLKSDSTVRFDNFFCCAKIGLKLIAIKIFLKGDNVVTVELNEKEAQTLKFLLQEHIYEMEELNKLNDASDAAEVIAENDVVKGIINKLN